MKYAPLGTKWLARTPLDGVAMLFVLILFALVPLLAIPNKAYAVSYTWDGGGTTSNWSDCFNWSTDVCPGSGDTVTFNGTSTKNSLVDASFAGTITTININSGFTGYVLLQRSLTVSNNFSQATAAFYGGSQILHVGKTFTISGGTFNAQTGTVDFNGTSSATLSCNSASFNSVTFTHTSGTKTVSSDCDLPLGNNPAANAGGSINLDGGKLSGSGTLATSGTLTMSEGAGGACYGAGGGSASGYDSGHDGGNASGAGCGGGGAGWYGGAGGDGQYGGGGGGAAGGHVAHNGGDGGQGMVVFSPNSGSDVAKTSGTSWTVPAGVTSVKAWAIGAGGGGAGVPGTDGTSGGAGGAGGTAYKTYSVSEGDTIDYSIGAAGSGGGASSNGTDGGDTTVTSTESYSGEALDSISGNNGTPVNNPAPTTSPVKLGSHAGDFTGSNDYLSINDDSIDLTADWSFESWVYLTTTSGTNPRIFGTVDTANNLNAQVGYTSSGVPYIRIGTGASGGTRYSFSTTFSTGVWQHVVYKYDSGSYYLYVNGTKYSVTGGSGPSANTSFSAIGAAANASWETTGYLDESVVYDAALTDAEVSGRYNSGSGTESLSGGGWDVSSKAVSQWHLNESAGWVGTVDVTITGRGGAGGTYNNNTAAAGGSYSGGDGGADGGDGSGASGDTGGGGGGAVGGGSPSEGGHAGDNGGSIVDVSGLSTVLIDLGYGASSSSELSGFSGLSANYLTVNETYDFSSFSPFTVSGVLDIEGSSIFTAPSGTATVGALYVALSNGPATFNAGSGTLNVDGNLLLSVFSADVSTFNGGSGTLNVGGSLYVDYAGLGGISASVFNASSGTTNVDGGLYVSSANPVFNASSGTVNVAGDFSLDDASNFSAGTGTLNFDGTSDGDFTCSSATFNEVNFTHTAGIKTVGGDCSLPLGSAPTIGGGAAGSTKNNINGSAADGFGSGGGGAGYYGGNGGDGLYGGGGGGAAGYNSANRIGGTGGGGVVVISPDVGTDVVLTTDNAWKVPAGVSSIKVWAIGAGGGGGGATSTDAGAGGGGGAGGVVYQTFSVSPDDLVTYTLGTGGAGGIDTDNGSVGGDTTVTVNATTITGGGGGGGTYNDGAAATGGSYTGGDGGAAGGGGSGATGNTGGGGGGGIVSGAPVEAGNAGDTGGQSLDVSGLFAVLTGLGYATTGPGAGGGSGSGISYEVVLEGTLSGSGKLTASSDLTLSSGGSLSGFSGLASNNMTVNGTYDFGSYSPFTSTGDFSVGSGGDFTAPSGTSQFSSNFTINSGSTFDANSGTVNFKGGTASIACGSKTFNLVTFTHSSGTKIIGSDCSLPLGSAPTVGSGTSSLSLSGTLSGSGKLTMGGSNTGTLTLGSGGSLSGFSGLSAKGLTVNGTYGFGSYSPFTTSGNFTVNSGASFTAPSGTASFPKNFTLNSGSTFNANGGTVNFKGGTATIACGSKTFSLVTLTHGSGTKTINSNCSLPLGSAPTLGGGGSTSSSGALSGSGKLTSTGTLTLGSGGSLSGFSGLAANKLTVNGTYGFGSYSPFTVSSSFSTGGSGNFTAPSGTATFSGNFSNTGTANANGGTMSIAGNFANSGSFNANGGTVVLNGSGQSLSGSTAFYNLTKTVSSADTLTFAAGSTQTVSGKLTLQGTDGNLLTLASGTPGTQWLINSSGTADVSYVKVSDSSSTGNAITACYSTDNGNNGGWSFNPASCYPDNGGGAASTIANFILTQAALINHLRGTAAGNGAFTLPDNITSALPSQIYSFLKQLPAGQSLLAAAKQFFTTILYGLAAGILLGILISWRHRHLEALAEREGLIDAPDSTPLKTAAGDVITPSKKKE